jgi:hypothetical protein
VSLSEPLTNIADRIISYFENPTTPPFIVYQYDPKVEWDVRRELSDLRRWLGAPSREVECLAISLADVFWEVLDASGHFQALVDAEVAGQSGEAQLAVRQILGGAPTIADRLVERIAEANGARTAVFLYRAGALYPAHRTSTLLDELRSRIDRPVTLLYPGRLVGDYGLSFMGLSDPAYGYRALIVPRGDRP